MVTLLFHRDEFSITQCNFTLHHHVGDSVSPSHGLTANSRSINQKTYCAYTSSLSLLYRQNHQQITE